MTDGTTAYRVRKGRVGSLLFAGMLIFLALSAFFAVVLQPHKKPAEPIAQITSIKPDVILTTPPRAVAPTAATIVRPITPQPTLDAKPATPGASATLAPLPAKAEVIATTKADLPALPTGKPLIAILVTDLGGDSATARVAIDTLPASVDLGFEPYAGNTRHMVVAASQAGHAIWVGVPMQPKRYPAINPGKNALLLKQSSEENMRRFDAILEQVGGKPAGVYNIMGSAFMADETALKPVFEKLKAKQNMAFFDMRSDQDSKGPSLAKSLDVSATVNQFTLNEDKKALPENLMKLARMAKKNGHAVAVINGDAASLKVLHTWLKSPEAENFDLVSASLIAAHGK